MSDEETKTISSKSQRSADQILHALREMIYAEQEREHSHTHIWKVVGVNSAATNNPNVQRHPREGLMERQPQTHVLLICRECNWPMAVSLIGIWTEEQLEGLSSATNDATAD